MDAAERTPPPLRSLLFVPADSERKLAHAERVPADALILDLEDSVAPARKLAARRQAVEFLQHRRAASARSLWVRVGAARGATLAADLEAIVPARPYGIVLPKPLGAHDVVALAEELTARERGHGLADSSIKILPIVTETPASVLALGDYARCGPRLVAMSWGAEDLGATLGATALLDERGEWLPPFALARSLCLLAAAAAGCAAIDTVYTLFRDGAGLLRQAEAARRDGFGGKLAIHPNQVAALNDVFHPSAAEIEAARRVVAAFAAAGDDGVVALDGRMLDRPHLQHARRVLDSAESLGNAAAVAAPLRSES